MGTIQGADVDVVNLGLTKRASPPYPIGADLRFTPNILYFFSGNKLPLDLPKFSRQQGVHGSRPVYTSHHERLSGKDITNNKSTLSWRLQGAGARQN